MMNIKCPNKTLPEWKELVEAVGENSAYYLWDLNNGYGLDKAPNGEPSKLFSDLLSHYNGDRNAAIAAKAKVYSEAFKNWFGDWLSDDKTNVSKVVDENGEPLIIYHGSDQLWTEFDPNKLGENTGAPSAKMAFFAASNKNLGEYYAGVESDESYYQNMLKYVDPNFTRLDLGIFSDDDPVDRLYSNVLSEINNLCANLYFNHKDEIDEYMNKHNKSTVETIRILINNTEEFISGISLDDYILEGYTITLQLRDAYNRGEDITIEKQAAIKRDVVSEGIDFIASIVFDIKLLTSTDIDNLSQSLLNSINDLHTRKILLLQEAKEAHQLLIDELNMRVKAIYLNIKDPKIDSDHGKTYRELTYAKRISDARALNKDGGIIFDTRDPYETDVYYFFNPNLAKAIDNQGTFSTLDNNVYNLEDIEGIEYMTTNLSPERVEKVSNYMVSKLTLKTQAHRPRSTKYLPDLIRDLGLDLFGVLPDTTVDIKDGKYLDEIQFFIYNTLYSRVMDSIDEARASLRDYKELSEVQVKNAIRSYLYDDSKLLSDYDISTRNTLASLLPAKVLKRDKKSIGYYKHMLVSSEPNKLNAGIKTVVHNNRLGKFKLRARLSKLQTVLDTLNIVPGSRKMMFDKFVSEYMRYLIYDSKPSDNKKSIFDGFEGLTNILELQDKYYNAPYEANQVFSLKQIQEGTNAKDALLTIIQNSNDPVSVLLAKHILPYVSENTKIDFLGVKGHKLSVGGTFFGKTGNIEIYTFSTLYQKHPEFTIIHEIIHSLSSHHIANNPVLYKELENVIDFLKSNSFGEWYAFTDPYELVAEFLSNPAFREFTKRVLVKGESRNLFQRILDAILDWIRPIDRHTVFDYLEDITDNIIQLLYQELLSEQLVDYDLSLTFNIADTIPQDLINQINSTYERIQKGLKDRLKSVKRYSTKNPRLWNQLSTVISLLANSEAELGILLFLLHISDTINDAIKFLQKPIDEINAKQIRQLSLDYVGFYKPLLDDIIYLFDTTDIFKDFPNYAELQRNAQRLSTEMDLVYNRFVHLLKAKGISELVSYLLSNNVPLSYIDKTLEWLNNPTNDISIFLNWFGMASNSNSMVTQAIAKMLNDTMNLTLRETMSKGIELVKLALAAKEKYGVDVLKLLYEKLNDGTYSGYRVRPINYGLYKKDKQLYLDKLANKLGITKDKEGHYNLPNDEAIQKKWFDGINKFYSERVNRRFTSEYYTTRNRMLSIKTRDALDEIQDYIDSIVSRVTRDGIQHDEELTTSEYLQLLMLKRLKQLLANRYNLDGSIKTGDDLLIANELSAFNEEVNKNVSREVDLERYDRDYKTIVKQYGSKDDPRVKLWVYRNTVTRYNLAFYDRLDSLNKTPLSDLYKELVLRRRELTLLFKDPETGLINPDMLSDELRAMLLQLDKDIDAARTYSSREEDSDNFGSFAEVVYTLKYYDDARAAQEAGSTLYQQWYELNHYEDLRGYMKPARYYTMLKPKDSVADKYTETVPTGRYTKIDPTSNWYNPDYDNNGPAILPKKKYYDNSKAYNEVVSKPEVKALYEAIVDTMNQANSYIPFLNMADDGRMSLMPARFAQVWARMTGITDRLKYAIDEVVTTLADDFDYVEEFATMPNGDPIKVIPTRFILMLENPNTISTDAVTATIAYYNMAVNFKNMLEQLDNIELMLGLLKGITIRNRKGTVQPGNSNLYKLAQLLVDRLMYGRNVNQVTANVLGKEINITKMATLLLSLIRKVNLSGNIWSIATSFFTDSTYTTLEAKLGRYFDKEDLLFATKEYARRLPNIMENIGNPVPNDKLSYLMLLNLVVRDNREVFNRIDLSQVLRSINNNFWYLGYTQSDYLVKSHTLMSVYHNYRLVDGKFMSKAEFINTYYPSNKKAGEAAFKLLEITAFDAYNEDGTVKEEYKSKITTKLMNDIKNRIDVLSRRIDGTLREVDKALIHANFLGQYVIMHKNFMIQGLHDRFKKKQFNLDTLMEEDGYYRSMARFLRNVIGNRHFGLTQLLADYNLLQEYELYAIKRVLHEMALFTSATLLALSLAALVDGDDDYDNWLMQSLTYLALRSAFEFRTMYNPMEFFSLIKSPTAAFTWFDNASAFINLFNPFSYIGSGGPFAIIDRGVYEGMPRILRNIIKVTPIRSIIEAGDPESKRSYLLNQLMSF